MSEAAENEKKAASAATGTENIRRERVKESHNASSLSLCSILRIERSLSSLTLVCVGSSKRGGQTMAATVAIKAKQRLQRGSGDARIASAALLPVCGVHGSLSGALGCSRVLLLLRFFRWEARWRRKRRKGGKTSDSGRTYSALPQQQQLRSRSRRDCATPHRLPHATPPTHVSQR